MSAGVCPWQAGGLLSAKIRRIVHNPEKMLSLYLKAGMTALDVGCGMGYFSLPMAAMVGEEGKVIAVDLQPEMLQGFANKPAYEALRDRLILHLCRENTLDLGDWDAKVDFALLMMMLHEVPDKERLVAEVHQALRLGGLCLFAEPVVHVNGTSFRESLRLFEALGFEQRQTPSITICRAALLEKVR